MASTMAEFTYKVQTVLNSFTENTISFYDYATRFLELLSHNVSKENALIAVGLFLCKSFDSPSLACVYAKLVDTVSKHSLPPEVGRDFCKELLRQYDVEFQRLITANKNRTEGIRNLSAETVGRIFGTARILGELFKAGVVKRDVAVEYIQRCLEDRNEESYEYLCGLLTTCGKDLEYSAFNERSSNDTADDPSLESSNFMHTLFEQLKELAKDVRKVPFRLRVAFSDLIEIRENVWVPQRLQLRSIESFAATAEVQSQAEEEDLVHELIKSVWPRKLYDQRLCDNVNTALSKTLSTPDDSMGKHEFLTEARKHSQGAAERLRKESLMFQLQLRFLRNYSGNGDESDHAHSNTLDDFRSQMWKSFSKNVTKFKTLVQFGLLAPEVMVDCIELLQSIKSEDSNRTLIALVARVQGIGNKDTINRPKKVLVFTNQNTGEKFNLGDTTPAEEGSTKKGKKKFEDDEKDNVPLENSHDLSTVSISPTPVENPCDKDNNSMRSQDDSIQEPPASLEIDGAAEAGQVAESENNIAVDEEDEVEEGELPPGKEEDEERDEDENEENEASNKPSIRTYDRELLLRIGRETTGLKSKVDIPIADVIKVGNGKSNHFEMSFNQNQRTPMNHRQRIGRGPMDGRGHMGHPIMHPVMRMGMGGHQWSMGHPLGLPSNQSTPREARK